MPPATLLAIDSSTERLCLALQAGDHGHVRELAGGAQASAQLLPAVQALLAEAGCSLQALDAVAFARGPGAFTGLRTACAVAQGLAFGAALPVLALDSLCIVAEDAHAAAGEPADFQTWVAMDARMDEVYAGCYLREGAGWRVVVAPGLYDLATLHALWQVQPPVHVCGSALQAFGERLHTGAAICQPLEMARAQALARVAQQAWAAGAGIPAEQALPLYLRDKVALTTAEREARRLEGGVR